MLTGALCCLPICESEPVIILCAVGVSGEPHSGARQGPEHAEVDLAKVISTRGA